MGNWTIKMPLLTSKFISNGIPLLYNPSSTQLKLRGGKSDVIAALFYGFLYDLMPLCSHHACYFHNGFSVVRTIPMFELHFVRTIAFAPKTAFRRGSDLSIAHYLGRNLLPLCLTFKNDVLSVHRCVTYLVFERKDFLSKRSSYIFIKHENVVRASQLYLNRLDSRCGNRSRRPLPELFFC